MDPNAALAEIRELLAQDRRQLDAGGLHRDDAATLMERLEALDEWLSKGGFLPADWGQHR